MGMVAAVDWFVSHTEESMQGDYQKRVDLIANAVKGITIRAVSDCRAFGSYQICSVEARSHLRMTEYTKLLDTGLRLIR